MELRKFIATTIREYLNEQHNLNNRIVAYHGTRSFLPFQKFENTIGRGEICCDVIFHSVGFCRIWCIFGEIFHRPRQSNTFIRAWFLFTCFRFSFDVAGCQINQ